MTIPRSKETNEHQDDDALSEASVAGCAAPISRTSSAAALMETDFPALEVRQLDEEPVRRRMDDQGGDRVYQGW